MKATIMSFGHHEFEIVREMSKVGADDLLRSIDPANNKTSMFKVNMAIK